jgi:hypothetical protein
MEENAARHLHVVVGLLARLHAGVKAVGLSDIPDDADAEVDIYGSGSALTTLSRVLGRHRRDDVLSSVYMLLCDNSGVVRQSALQVRVVSDSNRSGQVCDGGWVGSIEVGGARALPCGVCQHGLVWPLC